MLLPLLLNSTPHLKFHTRNTSDLSVLPSVPSTHVGVQPKGINTNTPDLRRAHAAAEGGPLPSGGKLDSACLRPPSPHVARSTTQGRLLGHHHPHTQYSLAIQVPASSEHEDWGTLQDCVHLAGPCYTFKDFFAPGFVFQLENGDVDQLARRVMKVVKLFLSEKVAHNLYITRGTNLDGKEAGEEYNTLRVIIWARKFVSGVKDITGFSAAACELASHVPVYSQDDWNSLAEKDVTQTVHSACLESYETMRPKVVSLFCDDDCVDGM